MTVRITDDLLELVDAVAKWRGISRSALIREAVRHYLAGSADVTISEATVDEWGNLAEFSVHAAREVGARLDTEERVAGTEPW